MDRIALRLGIAFIWLATGAGVLHPYYRAIGLRYLEPLQLPVAVMYGACLLEFILGLLLLIEPPRRWLTALQLLLIAGFTVVLSLIEPALLVHPFGVLSKNVSLAAIILAAFFLQDDPRSRRGLWALRFGVAFIWVWEGLFPCALFQDPQLREVLSFTGLTDAHPRVLLLLAGIGEILAGLAVLVLRGRALRMLLLLQLIGLITITILVSRHDPLLWFHPFGPVTKNIPLFAGTLVLWRNS